MVVYDPCCHTARVVEKGGTRYVYKITRERDGATVWGQADKRVNLSADDIGAMLVHPQRAAVPVDEMTEAPAMRSPGPLVIPLRRAPFRTASPA